LMLEPGLNSGYTGIVTGCNFCNTLLFISKN
jgi:hypothetical protein